jgi:hypothetical protein
MAQGTWAGHVAFSYVNTTGWYNGVAEIEWSEKLQEMRKAIENHARVLKEKVLAQVRGLWLMRCLDILFKMIFREEWESFERRGPHGKSYWHGRFYYHGFKALANIMGFPIIGREVGHSQQARIEKEGLDNERFANGWNRKLKVLFCPRT